VRTLVTTTVGGAIRVALLVVLAAAAVLVLLGDTARPATMTDLLRDLRADRVGTIAYRGGSAEWTAGVWRFSAPVPDPSGEDREWLRRQIQATGSTLPVEDRVSDDSLWAVRVPWRPLRYLAVAAWLLTFLIMLGRRRHRWANRWAWWWMFVIGIVGPLLYLALEPVPLWHRHGPSAGPPPDPAEGIIRGGAGFGFALGLALAVSLVRVAVGLLIT
jgi:hypothetical protein